MNHMSPTSLRPRRRDLHFDLSWLGPAHETEVYTLHIGGRRYRSGPAHAGNAGGQFGGGLAHSRRNAGGGEDRHTAAPLVSPAPTTPTVSRPWRRSAIHTADDAGSYSVDDVAKAVVFMNPTLTMLTTASAQTVLGHIGSNDNIQPLSVMISILGSQWCQPVGVVDDAGKPVLKPRR